MNVVVIRITVIILCLYVLLFNSCDIRTDSTLHIVEIDHCDQHKFRFRSQTHFLVEGYLDHEYQLDSVASRVACALNDSWTIAGQTYFVLFYKKTNNTTYDRLRCRPKPFYHDVHSDLLCIYEIKKNNQDRMHRYAGRNSISIIDDNKVDLECARL